MAVGVDYRNIFENGKVKLVERDELIKAELGILEQVIAN